MSTVLVTNVKANAYTLGTLFTAFLILSNLAGAKIACLGPFVFPAGLIFFPLTYLFDNILTEVYGFAVSRRIIWSALLANALFFLGINCIIYLPPAPFWPHQEAFTLVYQASLRIFLASTLSYLCGEFSNSIILAKLKVLMQGKHLWLRVILSTVTGVGLDTILFIHLAFLFTMSYSHLWQLIGLMYGFKVVYEILALPLTYKVTSYLKQRDNIDHFDLNTKFNPFSFKVKP